MRVTRCLVPYGENWVENRMHRCEQGLELWNRVTAEGRVQKCHDSSGTGKQGEENAIPVHLYGDTGLMASRAHLYFFLNSPWGFLYVKLQDLVLFHPALSFC